MNIDIYDDIKERYPNIYNDLKVILLLRTDNLVKDFFQTKLMLVDSINGCLSMEFNNQTKYIMFDYFNSYNKLDDIINSLYIFGYISRYDKEKLSFDDHHVNDYNRSVKKFFDVLSKIGLEFEVVPIIKVLEFKGIEDVLRNIYIDCFNKIKTTDNESVIKDCYETIYNLENVLFKLEKFRLIGKECVSFILKENDE